MSFTLYHQHVLKTSCQWLIIITHQKNRCYTDDDGWQRKSCNFDIDFITPRRIPI